MKKILQKISAALQVVLLAPIKLPGKALNIIKYIALGLGVVETVLDEREQKTAEDEPPVEVDDQAPPDAPATGMDHHAEKEVPDET